MRDFQRKKKIRKLLYSKTAILILFIMLIFVAKAAVGVFYKERESKKNLLRVEENLSALQAREDKLKEEIERLKTPEGVEAEIREQFQVAKPGERMVVLVEEKIETPEKQIERSMVSKFFDLFR